MSDVLNASAELTEDQFREWYEQLKAVVMMAEESGVADQADLGDACVQLGLHADLMDEEPLRWFTRAMEIYDRTVDANDPRQLRPLCELALAQIAQINVEDGMEGIERWWNPAHKILQSDVGRQTLENDLPLQVDLSTVEGFVKRKNDLDGATACFDHASAVAETYLDPNDPEWIQLLTNQAQAHQEQGDVATAQRLLERVLVLAKMHGEERPGLVSFCYELASLEFHYENTDLTRRFLEWVLAWQRTHLDAMDPELGRTYHQLMCAEEKLGNKTRAVEYSRQAIRILFHQDDNEMAIEDLCWLVHNDPDFASFVRELKIEECDQDEEQTSYTEPT